MSELHRPSADVAQPLKVVIVDISEHRRQLARDSADARLNEETAAHYASRGEAFRDWKGFVGRVWKGNIFREYYQQKYYRQEIDRLDESDNLYAHEHGDDQDALTTVIDRFASEYDEVIHVDAGERRDRYGADDTVPNNVRQNIKDLITEFATGALDAAAFEEEKNRVCALTANGNQERMAGGLLYADNLLEIAENVKAAVEHGRALEEMVNELEIVTGEARMGARTEARFNKIDTLVDKLTSTRIGGLIPEATIAASVAIASGFVKWGSQKALSAALLVTGALGVTGGVLGALRESKRIKQDRALHMRDRALGKEFDADARRRGELEQSRYETLSATELRERLDSYFDGDTIRDMSSDEYLQATTEIASIMERIRLSDSKKIDLIHFSSLENVEGERFDLDLALARAKVGMGEFLSRQPTDFLPAGLRVGSFSTLLSGRQVASRSELNGATDARDVAFNSLKRKEVLKAAGKAFGWGLVFGASAQEVLAHLPGNDSYAGLGEDHNGTERTTTLHALFQGREQAPDLNAELIATQAGDHSTIEVPSDYEVRNTNGSYEIFDQRGEKVTTLGVDDQGRFTPSAITEAENTTGASIVSTEAGRGAGLSGISQEQTIADQIHKLNIPREFSSSATANADGSHIVTLMDQNGDKITDFAVLADGTLPQPSIDALQNSGLQVSDAVDLIGSRTTTTVATPEELLWNTADQATNVRRTLWYGNDTPGIYDQNELRAHAGGVNGDWFDAGGNVVIDVTPMQPNGSFWQGESANPWELAQNGQLRAGISLSKGTQDFVYDFTFEQTPEGRLVAIIPPDNPAHQLFEAGNEYNGHGAFNGRYVEIMEFTGESDPTEGQEVHMLATYVGQNDAANLETVIDTTESRHTINIEALAYTDQSIIFTPEAITTQEVTPITPIPIFARKGLEKTKSPEKTLPPRTPYGYMSGPSPERARRWARERSPRLRNNPNAELSAGEELDWYRDQLIVRRGAGYVAELNGYIDASDVLSVVDDRIRSIVSIPVYGPGESENIYDTLSLYGRQSEEGKASSVILLNVNWPESDDTDPIKRAAIDKTLAEIERAKADYPDLKIATFQKKWSQELIDLRTTYGPDGKPSVNMFGEVVKVLYDTALMTVQRSIADGRRAPDNDAVLVTNDADAVGMRAGYLEHYVEALDKYRESDVFSGAIRFDTRVHGDYPGFGIATNLMSILSAASSRKTKDYTAKPATPGANSGFRMSTFAAIGGPEDEDDLGAGADTILGYKCLAARNVEVGASGAYGSRARGTLSGAGVATRTAGTVIKHLIGAQIDTNGDRFIATYLLEKAVGSSWDEFNGITREQALEVVGTSEKESAKKDIDTIARRLEREISYLGEKWYPNPKLVSWALAAYFGIHDQTGRNKGAKLYTSEWTPDGYEFQFTPEGKLWLKDRLMRDQKGRFDPYGKRINRRLYNKSTPRRKPVTAEPRMTGIN